MATASASRQPLGARQTTPVSRMTSGEPNGCLALSAAPGCASIAQTSRINGDGGGADADDHLLGAPEARIVDGQQSVKRASPASVEQSRNRGTEWRLERQQQQQAQSGVLIGTRGANEGRYSGNNNNNQARALRQPQAELSLAPLVDSKKTNFSGEDKQQLQVAASSGKLQSTSASRARLQRGSSGNAKLNFRLAWKSSTSVLQCSGGSDDKQCVQRDRRHTDSIGRSCVIGKSTSLLQLDTPASTSTRTRTATRTTTTANCQSAAAAVATAANQRQREQIANQRRASSLAAEISLLKSRTSGGASSSSSPLHATAAVAGVSSPSQSGVALTAAVAKQRALLFSRGRGELLLRRQADAASQLTAKSRASPVTRANTRVSPQRATSGAPQTIQRFGKSRVGHQQQVAAAPAAVTNTRLRQGALYARRQLHLAPPNSDRALAATRQASQAQQQVSHRQDTFCRAKSSFGLSSTRYAGAYLHRRPLEAPVATTTRGAVPATCRRPQVTGLTRLAPSKPPASTVSVCGITSTRQRAASSVLFELASRRLRTAVVAPGGRASKKLSLNSSSSSLSLDAPIANIKRPRGDPAAAKVAAAGSAVAPRLSTPHGNCRRRWSSLESSSSTAEASSLTVSSSSSALSAASSSSCLANQAPDNEDERSGRQRRRASAAAAAVAAGNRQAPAGATSPAAATAAAAAAARSTKVVAALVSSACSTRCCDKQQLEKVPYENGANEKRHCDTGDHQHKRPQLQDTATNFIRLINNNNNNHLDLRVLQPAHPQDQSLTNTAIECPTPKDKCVDITIDYLVTSLEPLKCYAPPPPLPINGIINESILELEQQKPQLAACDGHNECEIDVELFPVENRDNGAATSTGDKSTSILIDSNLGSEKDNEQMVLTDQHHKQLKLDGRADLESANSTALESQHQPKRRQSQVSNRREQERQKEKDSFCCSTTTTSTATALMSCDLASQEQQQNENINNLGAIPSPTVPAEDTIGVTTQMISVKFPKVLAAVDSATMSARSQPHTLLQPLNIDQLQNHQSALEAEELSHDQETDRELALKPADVCSDGVVESINQENLVGSDKQQQPDAIITPESSTKTDNIISICHEPICDYYDLETRPFARGKFAQVKRCVKRDTRQCYAAKCIKKRRRLVDIRHEILLEIEALKLSYHTEYIVKLYEVYETPNEMILILEMANGGELQRVLDDEEAIEEPLARKMIKQILDGLVHLHNNQIAHLDIKPQNLLLTEPFPHGDVKLCDFGISRRITKDCEIRDICGTPDYVAPEILRYDPISLATDMWSLGVLTYVLLSGYSPFGSENKQQTFCNITQANLDFPDEIFGKITEDAVDFIRKLIVREPSGRLTSVQARSHHWINQ